MKRQQMIDVPDNLDCADCGEFEMGRLEDDGRYICQQCALPVNAGEKYLEEARDYAREHCRLMPVAGEDYEDNGDELLELWQEFTVRSYVYWLAIRERIDELYREF